MTGSAAPTARLEDLHDIVVPAGVAAWPPAPGWFALAVVALVAGAWLITAARRRRSALRYRQAALVEFRALPAGAEGARLAAVLLKRTAIHAYGRARVATLSGDAWLAFLDDHGGGGRFREAAGRTLLRVTYGDLDALAPTDTTTLLGAVEAWILAQGVPPRVGGETGS